MSTSSASSFTIINQQLTIYLGLFVVIAGSSGGILNIIVFLSLKTFRQNSCVFYLTMMSLANIAHLILAFIPLILNNGFGNDWPIRSTIACKLRTVAFQLWLLTSFTCMCLATVDQFLATNFNPQWHRWCNIKFARYIVAGFFLLWLCHGIPSVVLYNIIPSTTNPDQLTCTYTNRIFQQYSTFAYTFTFTGCLPLAIMIIFGSLAYYNVRNLTYRTVPLVRRELDKQLTQMVLTQVIYNCFVLTPFVITTLVLFFVPTSELGTFIRLCTVTINNFYFASPFYIYICVSKRFRQQFYYVVSKFYINHCKPTNQVLPQLPVTSVNNI